MLTKGEVKEFQKLVLKIYGIKLTYKQALEQGSRLICIFELHTKYKANLSSPIEITS